MLYILTHVKIVSYLFRVDLQMVEELASIFISILLWMIFLHGFSSSWRIMRIPSLNLNGICCNFICRSSCLTNLCQSYVRYAIVDLFYHCLSQVMLWISIYWLVFTHNTIKYTRRLLIVNFSFLPKIDTSDPFMLYFLKGWFYFEYGG